MVLLEIGQSDDKVLHWVNKNVVVEIDDVIPLLVSYTHWEDDFLVILLVLGVYFLVSFGFLSYF